MSDSNRVQAPLVASSNKHQHHNRQSSASEVHSAKREIRKQLQNVFPTIEKRILDAIAEAVATGRNTMEQATQRLSEMCFVQDTQAVQEADAHHSSPQRPPSQPQRPPDIASAQLADRTDQGCREMPRIVHAPPAVALSQVSGDDVAAAAPSDNYDYGLLRPDEVIVYTTSVTNSREVRDHCRQLINWVYILRVSYREVDVTENAFLRKRLIAMCGNRDLGLPLLFVGETFVGDFATIQQLVDDQVLIYRLEQLGYRHDWSLGL